MSHHIVEATDLRFTYPDGHQAINGISFLLRHGESVGIIGANGAGKTTLLMLMLGVLLPTSGNVRVGEVEVTRKAGGGDCLGAFHAAGYSGHG